MLSLVYRTVALSFKATILLALVGALIAYATIRWNLDGVRTTLSERIEAATGRRLTIAGDVGIEFFSWPPRITFGDVRLGNAPWGSRADMARVRRLEAEVDLLPLLRGDMAVPRLRLVGVDILLETNRRGENNWDDLANFETAAGPVPISGVPIFGPVLGSGSVAVAGGTVTYNNAAAGTTQTFNLGGGEVEVSTGAGGRPGPC